MTAHYDNKINLIKLLILITLVRMRQTERLWIEIKNHSASNSIKNVAFAENNEENRFSEIKMFEFSLFQNFKLMCKAFSENNMKD